MDNIIGLAVGFFLTLCIYSYIFGDNLLYRLGIHVLVGVSAAYAAVVAVQGVLLPALINPPTDIIQIGAWVLPLFLGVLLLFSRLTPRLTSIGNLSVATLIGIGAAVALSGVIMGTLLPQVAAGGQNALLGAVTAVLTVCTLLYFHFAFRTQPDQPAKAPGWQRFLGGGIGRAVIMITFGVLFASVLTTSLTLLTTQIGDIIEFFFSLTA